MTASEPAATSAGKANSDITVVSAIPALNAMPIRTGAMTARAAMGVSVDATARDIGVAKSSVLTYRQRAYQRPSVRSPVELSALVAQ